ncbi:transcriptional regulator XRE family [Candidatus Termititenax persephonae]|uniref:Transcriptional regulator XRE family n=1 Tax=Candidatus Termititenax persephonae TaxID=2218525 RepID=A0A388THZ3_9BACT|nr:transcriptional regulator XRE family [Candidatus Termititenax persephonae]
MSDEIINILGGEQPVPERLSVGQQLKAARENKKLKISDIAERTKIKKAFLEYLENDEFDKLPNIMTAKGFTKVYAGFLGLNPKEITDIFSDLYPETADCRDAATEIKVGMTVDKRTLFPNGMRQMNAPGFRSFHSTRNNAKNNKLFARILLGILAVACVLGIFIWGLNTSIGNIKNPNIRQQSEKNRLDAKDTPESRQQALNPNKVYINAQANNRTYVSVIIDGRTIFQGNMERGDAQSWEGDQYIKIRATIPRNLRLYINGNDSGVLDEQTTMLEKTFYSQGGLRREEPAPSPPPRPQTAPATVQTEAATPTQPVSANNQGTRTNLFGLF